MANFDKWFDGAGEKPTNTPQDPRLRYRYNSWFKDFDEEPAGVKKDDKDSGDFWNTVGDWSKAAIKFIERRSPTVQLRTLLGSAGIYAAKDLGVDVSEDTKNLLINKQTAEDWAQMLTGFEQPLALTLKGVGEMAKGAADNIDARNNPNGDNPYTSGKAMRALGDLLMGGGEYFAERAESPERQQAFHQKKKDYGTPADMIANGTLGEYFLDPGGFGQDLASGLGNAAYFMTLAKMFPTITAGGRLPQGVSAALGNKITGTTSGLLNRAGLNKAAQVIGSNGARDLLSSGIEFAPTMGLGQAITNAGTIVDALRQQGLSDAEIYERQKGLIADELPADMAFAGITGPIVKGLVGKALAGRNASIPKLAAAQLPGVGLESAGGFYSNLYQMMLSEKYSGKPYGEMFGEHTQEEADAANLGLLLGAIFSAGGMPNAVQGAREADARYNRATEQTNLEKALYPKFREDTQKHLDKYGEAGRQSYRDAVNEGNLRELARREAVPDNVFDTIMRVADEEGVPRERLLATVIAESNGNQDEISPVGAIGVMQLMPETAEALGVDPDDLEQNIRGGARYLKQQYSEFGDWSLAHAAYNAGPNVVKRYGGVPPFAETQNYVNRINGLVGDIPSSEGNEQRGDGYYGEGGAGEGNTWFRQGNASLEGAQPNLLNAIDMLADWLYKKTGRRLVVTSGTDGHSHADGDHSHYSGWKVDVVDEYADGEDSDLITADFQKGNLADEFIAYGRSLGLGMNFEAAGTDNVHFDVALDGTQWDGNGDNAGGFNPRNGRNIQTRADEIYANKKRGLDANAPSWSDYVKAASKTNESTQETEPEKPRQISLDDAIFSDFANDRLAKAVEDKDVDTIQFFSGMFEDDGTFANTRKNRARIQQRYGDEVTQFAETRANTSETAQPAQSQTTQANPQPKQSQPATPAQKPQSSKYLRNDPVIQAGNKFLEELNTAGKKENTATALQLSAAIQQGDATEIKNILKQNGRENLIQQVQQEPQAQPQEDPVKQNTTPENKLVQPQTQGEPQETATPPKQKKAPMTGEEKASKELKNGAEGNFSNGKRKKMGRAVLFLADKNGVEIPEIDRKKLEAGNAKTINRWRDELLSKGHITLPNATSQTTQGKTTAQPTTKSQATQETTPAQPQQPSLIERARAIVKEATDAARQNWNDIKQDYRERGARARMPQSQSIDRAVASRPSAKRFSQRAEINQEVYDPTVANTAERERIDNISAWRGRTREENLARRRNLRGEIDDSIQRRRQRRATNLVNSLPDQELEATIGTQDIQNTEDTIDLNQTREEIQAQEEQNRRAREARQQRQERYSRDESQPEIGAVRGENNPESEPYHVQTREEIQAREKAHNTERTRQRQANDSYARDDAGEVQPAQVSYGNRDSAENPDDAINLRQVIKAVKSGKIQDTPKVASKETTQSQNKVYGNSVEVVSDKQSPYQTKYRVVEADELNASHTMDGDNVFANENYPKELQPRDRNRVEMSAQAIRMANSLSPAELMESRNANQGAPVIRSDGVVLNGNGRTMAIRHAYETGKGEEYKNAVVQNAEKLGLDADKVSKMRRPVLVREVAQDISDEAVRDLTTSTVGGARLGASEQAKVDATKISKEALNLFPEDEVADLTQAKSQDFVRAVIGDITANADERNALVDTKGNIAQDGINRVKRALFARAYDDDGLISRMSESTDDNIRGVSNALLTAAPEIAKVQKSMEAGALYDYDLSAIPAAAKKLSSLRNEGKTVATFLKEQSLFGEEAATPEAKEILRFLDRKKFAPNKIAQFLREIAKGIRNQGNPNQGSLFGAREPKPLLDIIKRAADNVENGGQADMFAEAERANENKGAEQNETATGAKTKPPRESTPVKPDLKGFEAAVKRMQELKQKRASERTTEESDPNETAKSEKPETEENKPAEKDTAQDTESGQAQKEKVTPEEAAKRYNESNSIEGGADTRIINLVDDAKLTPRQKLLKDFAAKLGVPIQFFDNPDGRFHGAFADGITFLNVNSKKGLGGVFWHESFHWLKANNPKLYAKLVDAAGITQAQRDAFLKRTGRKDLTTNEEIDEEILADQMEDVAKRTGLLQSIAGKNRGLVERVVQWLKDTMNKFIATFRNPTGRLTTAQAQALAGEFGKIARGLKDANGNRIFRVNNRTGDVEVIGGRNTPNVSRGQIEIAAESENAKYSFAGKKAKTADKESLRRAKMMDKRGASRDQIYQVTGWFKGKDGKWRFEIPDNREQMHLDRLTGRGRLGKYFQLADVYDNPELYAAYPKLQNVSVIAVDPEVESAESNILDDADAAAIGNKIIFNANRLDMDLDEAQKTLVHEIQHFIQDYEKFASGGNPSNVKAELRRNADMIMRAVDKIPDGKKYFDSIFAVKKAEKRGNEQAEIKARKEMTQARQNLSSEDRKNVETLARRYDEIKTTKLNSNKAKKEAYERLGGEQEARHVEERLDNREGTPVAHDEDALIVFGGKTYSINKKIASENGDGELVEESIPRSAATTNGTTDKVGTNVSTGSDNKGGVSPTADVETNSPSGSISQGRQGGNIKYSIDPADNSNQSWGRRLKNWMAGLTGSKKSPDRIHQEMKQRLMDLSNMKIAAGHLPKGMQESVDEVARVIRTKKEYDWVKVLPHVGNSVAAQLGITQSVEMSNCIAKYLYDGVVDEQSAEGKEFIQAMRNNEEMRDKILATQEVFGRWREMSTVEKQIASIQFGKPKENLTAWERVVKNWREMRRQLFDAQAPIGYQVEHFEKATGMKLADSLNPAVAFSRLRGTQGLALSMIDGGREEAAVLTEKFANINFDNWKSVAEILHMAGAFKSAQNYKEFATFVTANQILTLHKHNDNNRKKQAEIRQKISELKADLNLAGTKTERDRIEKSIERKERALSDLQDSIKELPEAWDTKEKCEKAIAELSAKHGDKFEKAQKALVEYSNTLMAMRVDAGLMSTRRFNELLNAFPDYVPLHRIFDENSDLEGDSDKHMVGSGKDIIDPIQAIMDNTFDIVHRCEKNKAKQMLATLARFDGVGRIFEEVEPGSNDGTIINFYEGGKRKCLQCADPALAKAVNNLAPAPMNWAMKLFRVPTLVLKGATTALSPAFMARNLFRDPQDAYVYSAKGGGNVFKDALRYMTPLFALKCTFDTLCGNNKTYEALINKLNMEVDKKLLAQYRIYGGSQSTFFDFDANVKADLFAKYTKGNWKRFASPKGVLRFLEKLGELSERGTRLQRFKQVKDNLKEQHGGINIYDDLVTAAFESRDLMDFARHGEAGHTWNTMAAFANPALQGIDKLIRTFDVNKLKKFGGTEETQKQWMSSVARLMIGSILPAIVLTVLHKDDDWYKDDLQPWEKDAYWIISEDFKIPKGADVATRFFSNLAEALVNSDNEPIKAKRILMPLYDGLPNLLPTAMAPVIECFFNKDMFKGTPIIPMRERYLSATPEKQYDSSNSNFAIWLGNKLGVSPRQIDHMIYGYTGNLGKGAMKVVDTGLHATGLSDKPVQPWTQAWIPVVGGFLREPYANSKIVRDYYAELDKQRSYVEAYKLDRKTDKNAKLDEDFDRKWYARLKAGEKAMGEFAKHERAILDNPKLTSEQVEEQRRKIQEKRIALLRRIFEYKRAQ